MVAHCRPSSPKVIPHNGRPVGGVGRRSRRNVLRGTPRLAVVPSCNHQIHLQPWAHCAKARRSPQGFRGRTWRTQHSSVYMVTNFYSDLSCVGGLVGVELDAKSPRLPLLQIWAPRKVAQASNFVPGSVGGAGGRRTPSVPGSPCGAVVGEHGLNSAPLDRMACPPHHSRQSPCAGAIDEGGPR